MINNEIKCESMEKFGVDEIDLQYNKIWLQIQEKLNVISLLSFFLSITYVQQAESG
jgi:hypothetical protein